MEDVIVGCCVRRTLQSEAKVLKHFFFKGLFGRWLGHWNKFCGGQERIE
jgi:hypothetical protein